MKGLLTTAVLALPAVAFAQGAGAQYEESMSIGPNTGSLVIAAAKELIQRKA